MTINKDVTKAPHVFQYRLETFSESRSTEWSYEPYNGDVSRPCVPSDLSVSSATPNVGHLVYCCCCWVQASRWMPLSSPPLDRGTFLQHLPAFFQTAKWLSRCRTPHLSRLVMTFWKEVGVVVFAFLLCWWGTCPLQGCHVCVGMGRRPCKECAGYGNVSRHLLLYITEVLYTTKLFNHTADFSGPW